MSDTYRQLFQLLPETEPTKQSFDLVVASVERFQVRRFRIRLAFFGTISGTAIVAAVPAAEYMISTAHDSGFFQYLSLITSDGQSLTGHWSELATIIANSAPVLGIACLATIALVLVYSVSRMTAYIPALSSAVKKNIPAFA